MSKNQCKNCHKFGHFSSLSYKKIGYENKGALESRSPKAHQLQIGSVCVQDSICGQSEDLSSSDESFCLQMKIKSNEAETPAPQHLITNLAYKLKPNQKKTQCLSARIDTCTDVNILPVSMYKLLCDDPDCKRLAPSSKEIGTYTTDKINIVWSCGLFVVHPDTRSLKQITFHVTSHDSSVVLSYETRLGLSLIQPSSNLDEIPDSASLIYSNADHPMKSKSTKSVRVSNQSQSVLV